MFEILYPPCTTSSTHGIKVYWEVQLIHPDFVDQELVGDVEILDREGFLV